MREPILRPVMPELDSIRGLAIFAVLVYHGFYWNADLASFPVWQRRLITLTWPGRLGVNLFFVLSGFLITGILLDSKARPDYYKRFYVRRARRILPAYALILALLFVLRYPPAFLGLSALYLSNLTPLFGVAIAYPVLWSLAVEEHFYFVWPAIVRRTCAPVLLAICTFIVLGSPILRYLSFSPARFEFNDYTWNSADGLACGAAVAILVRTWAGKSGVVLIPSGGIKNPRHLPKLGMLVAACLAAALILSPFAISTRQGALGAALQVTPWHFLFTALLGAFLLIGTSEHKAWVNWPVLRFFGRISYGLYLVHLLAFRAVDHLHLGLIPRFVLAASLATFLAWLSREYFEERFLHPAK